MFDEEFDADLGGYADWCGGVLDEDEDDGL